MRDAGHRGRCGRVSAVAQRTAGRGGQHRRDQLRGAFDAAAAAMGSHLDPEQRTAADRLADLGAGLDDSTPGVYLHGPVGRGKTWLADVLLSQLPEGTSTRLHAYDAARQLHRGIARRSGGRGGLEAAIDDVVGGATVLLLDELHAHDPGDAMLLSRFLRALPPRGVRLVATSNYAPEGLLPGPQHHHLVLPLVSALRETCAVVEVAGPVDHRALGHGGARPGWSSGAWLVPGSAAQLAAVGLAEPAPGDRVVLQVGGRPLRALGVVGEAVHLHFDDLCDAPTSTGDALELSERFRTLVLAGVPALSSVGEQARRRFADLVDVCWDRDVRLVVRSAVAAEEALDAGVRDRERLVSRLSLLRADAPPR